MLPKLATCEWTGTMVNGTSLWYRLGLIRTKAIPNEDGSYQVSGQFSSPLASRFIRKYHTFGFSRTPDSPEELKISLFVVQKFLINEDGSLGERNNLSVGKIEKKMGSKVMLPAL